jgi:two-component system, NtrC family, sensor kinase
MNGLKIFLLILLLPYGGYCQYLTIDSLEVLKRNHTSLDSGRVKILNELSFELRGDDIPCALSLGKEALELARTLHYSSGEVFALAALANSAIRDGQNDTALKYGLDAVTLAATIDDFYIKANAFWSLGFVYFRQGNYSKSIPLLQEANVFAKRSGNLRAAAISLQLLGRNYENLGDYSNSLKYSLESLEMSKRARYSSAISFSLSTIGNSYLSLGDFSQALKYQTEALSEANRISNKRTKSFVLNSLGDIYRFQGNYLKAIEAYQQAFQIDETTHDLSNQLISKGNTADVYERLKNYPLAFKFAREALNASVDSAEKSRVQIVLAAACLHTGKIDSALFYGLKGLGTAIRIGRKPYSRDASLILSEIYVYRKDYVNAYRYQILFSTYKDSIAVDQTARRAALVQYQSDLDKKQSQITLLSENNKLQTEAVSRQRQFLFASFTGLTILLLLLVVLIHTNRQRQRNNSKLSRLNDEIKEQNKEIERKNNYLEKALNDLKSTQSQLIQSEKMASLGELTAGIAHEIQNPLNFVNNFSEINTELIDELEQEADKGNIDEVKALAKDIKENEEKINHHGKRADAIVKGMLLHSRRSSGVKEPTDINKLTDEYLRMAYHGLRAKDKSFNATLKTDYDETIGNINIIPQDIGRVILNLITNAFYAVAEKKKAQPDYEPIVTVSTRGTRSFGEGRGEVKIMVKDNGSGIPQKILDKIFQPFFTTKPTGQGTGLGLSLAYDIIKAHGGELKVETKQGDYAEFVITLPL